MVITFTLKPADCDLILSDGLIPWLANNAHLERREVFSHKCDSRSFSE